MADQMQAEQTRQASEAPSAIILNPTEHELETWREEAEERHREWLVGLRDHADN